MKLLGIEVASRGQAVEIDDGVLDATRSSTVSLSHELTQHLESTLTPVLGWGGYTHLLRFEDVAWGVLVSAI